MPDPIVAPDGDSFKRETDAIAAVLRALEPLDVSARKFVLEYAAKRLEVNVAPLSAPALTTSSSVGATTTPGSISHIRDLGELKQPKSDSEKAALVAYY